MKWNREKAILEILQFAYEVNLGKMRSNKRRFKVWERLKKYLFWDDPEAHLENLDELNEIQAALKGFFDEYFIPVLDAYFSSPWKETPSHELDKIAKKILSEGEPKDYEKAFDKAIEANPILGEIWAKGSWYSKELPAPNPKRFFYCDGKVFRCTEDYESLSAEAVQGVIRLFAMSPPLPLTKFYQCQLDECNKWAINNRKSRKHYCCSKKCYNRDFKRQERSTEEGRELNKKRAKAYYYEKTAGYVPKHLK